MKKLFLVFVLLFGASLALGKEVPIKISIRQANSNSDRFLMITSLYDGRLVIDFSKITFNKGRCQAIDYDKASSASIRYTLSLFSDVAKSGLNGEISEETKAIINEDLVDRRVLAFDYGDKDETLIGCDESSEILEVKIPTSVGTFTFNL